MGATQELAKFVVSFDFDEIPERIVSLTKLFILDWTGSALVGSSWKQARIVIDLVKESYRRGRSTIIGDGSRVSSIGAALANGTMSHVVELDDAHYGANVHMGVVTIPAALAVAENKSAGGRDLINSVVLGCETQARIGIAVNPSHYNKRQFHSTGTVGSLGAAVVAGKLLNLNEEELAMAIGIAGTQAAGLKESFGTMCTFLHAGMAAYHGVLAAVLVQRGFTGSRTILEGDRGFCHAMSDGYDLGKITEDLGRRFEMENIAFKRHVGCACSHAAIDALLDILGQNAISPDTIEEVDVDLGVMAYDNVSRIPTPRTIHEAMFSLPYCLAVASFDRAASLPQFTEDKVRNDKISDFTKRVRVRKGDFEGMGARVTVKTTGQHEYVNMVKAHKGNVGNPLSRGEIVDKFRMLAGYLLPEERIDRIINLVDTLDDLRNVRDLTNLLRWKTDF